LEIVMNKPFAILIAGLAMSSIAPANAAPYSPADVNAGQQMVQAMTEQGENTTGARATAKQAAESVSLSRQMPAPTMAERRAEVIGAAVYPQSGPTMAAMAKKNTEMSKQFPKATVKLGTPSAEKFLEEASTP
jgi:hypothetical protein